MLRRYSLFIFLSSISIILILAFLIDLSPLLRGPAPYPPDWRWPYQLINTLPHIWAPIIVFLGILTVAYSAENKRLLNSTIRIRLLIILLIILNLSLQISLLYYSRSGLSVLVHRTINPMISGYFTTSLSVSSFSEFIKNFNQSFGDYPMYARFHPPGSILLYRLITLILSPISSFLSGLLGNTPSHADVAVIWRTLSNAEKTSALLSGIIIPILASITIIPIYLSTKILYGKKTALRSSVLFSLVPGTLLFLPLIDILLPLFTTTSLYFFVKALKLKKVRYYFISGLILFVGLFFSLTFLPLVLFFLVYLFIAYWKNNISLFRVRKPIIIFFAGLLGPMMLLYILGMNFGITVFKIMQFHELAQGGRGHMIWFGYNIYDFILFSGIPIGILFICIIYKLITNLPNIKKSNIFDPLFISFLVMLLVLSISGSVRGEAGRIWIPFIPLMIMPVSNLITHEYKWDGVRYFGIILIMFFQLIVFQTVLVTIW